MCVMSSIMSRFFLYNVFVKCRDHREYNDSTISTPTCCHNPLEDNNYDLFIINYFLKNFISCFKAGGRQYATYYHDTNHYRILHMLVKKTCNIPCFKYKLMPLSEILGRMDTSLYRPISPRLSITYTGNNLYTRF